MKTKNVVRYYCDFCGKGFCRKNDAIKHENACTKNPDRVCQMCLIMDEIQIPINRLKALLPTPNTDKNSVHFFNEDFNPLEQIKKHVVCPVCIFAAIRQSDMTGIIEYDLKKELKEVWNEINDTKRGY